MMDAANAGLTPKGSILIQRQVFKYKPKKSDNENFHAKAIMSDDYIDAVSSKQAFDKYNSSMVRKAEKGFLVVGAPLAVSLWAGARTQSKKVSDKVANSIKTIKYAGVALIAGIGVYKAIDAANKKVPVLREFKQDNPGITGIGRVVTAIAAAFGANAVVDAAAKKASAFELVDNKIVEPIGKKITEAKKMLDGSKKLGPMLDKKIYNPIKSLIERPGAKVFAEKYAVPLITAGGVFMMLFDIDRISKNKQKIKKQMQQERAMSVAKLTKNPFGEPGISKVVEKTRVFLIPAKKEA